MGADGMRIKAQGLLNAATWIEQAHGPDLLREVLSRCSPAVRERYMTALPLEWHPVEEFTELLENLEAQLGCVPGQAARQAGAAGARINTQGLVKRAVFYIASPKFLFNRVASMWSQFNDRGSMIIRELNAQAGLIEVEGVPHPHALFCATISGWVGVFAETMGMVRPKVTHVECRAKGQARCLWRLTWAGTQSEELKSALTSFPSEPIE